MSSLAAVWAIAACAITGGALYVTRAVLDQVFVDGHAVRLALLPPWQALAGFLAAALLLWPVIDHMNAPRGTTSGRRPRAGELLLPLMASGLLVVPFLPVLADRWPVLQILGGPLRYVVWLVLASQLGWVLWQARLITPRWIERWSVGRAALVVGLATAAASGLAASHLTATSLFPSGDEPHYLVMAQSLWRDGDLKIENNHRQRDYREYYALDLEPDYLTRGADGEIYSIHPVGLPFLMAPVYAAGGYTGVVAVLVIAASLAAGLAWWWTVGALNAPGAATFAWAAVALSAPYLFNTFTIYPEILAALAVMAALTATAAGTRPPTIGRWLVAGVAAGALPWLSTKYAPMSAALVAVALWRLPRPSLAALAGDRRAWALAAPYVASLVAWSSFFYAYWGSPWPQAPYGSMTQTSPVNMATGVPALLFDQEYGVLAVAPVYVLAATGAWRLWRAGGVGRRLLIDVAVIFGALFATVASHQLWWGGTAAPGRPLASGLLLLTLPIAASVRGTPAGSAQRAGQHLLLWLSLGIAVTLAVGQDGALLNNLRDGSSALLEWWLPRWHTWTLAPSFVPRNLPVALGHAAVWLIAAGGASWVLSRWPTRRAGGAALAAMATFSATLIAVAIVMPWLPQQADVPKADLHARARLATLDAYDAHALPSAVLFTPWRRMAAADAVPLMRLEVTPGIRTDPQPVRVIHNGRFTIPAGRYTIAVSFGDEAPAGDQALSLQLGRVGPPFQSWHVSPRPGGLWMTTVDVLVDQSFVGLRGSRELERGVTAITITPESVVDASERPLVPTVLSAARYAGVDVFLHDEQIYPEPAGFWTLGRASSRLTAAPADPAAPVTLVLHPGPVPNQVTLTSHGWEHSMDLVPGERTPVELPPPTHGVVALTITTRRGFSPKDADPASTDPRFLGAWVQVGKEQ